MYEFKKVYLFDTEKSLDEITQGLNDILVTSPPKILNSKEPENPLWRVYNSGRLFDKGDPKDRQKWIYKLLGDSEFLHLHNIIPVSDELVKLQRDWIIYLYSNWEYLKKIFRESKVYTGFFWDRLENDINWFERLRYNIIDEQDIIPLEFLDDFLKNKSLPKYFEIPEKKNLQYWEGKVGFFDDHGSITFDYWESIFNLFKGYLYIV